MKKRNGFVSNSSSSSFMVATRFTCDELKDILDKQGLSYPEIEENALGQASFSGWTFMWNTEEDMGEELVAIVRFLRENYEKSYMILTEADY